LTVVRQGTELTVINSVRPTEAGEKQLDASGKVTHLVRICPPGRVIEFSRSSS